MLTFAFKYVFCSTRTSSVDDSSSAVNDLETAEQMNANQRMVLPLTQGSEEDVRASRTYSDALSQGATMPLVSEWNGRQASKAATFLVCWDHADWSIHRHLVRQGHDDLTASNLAVALSLVQGTLEPINPEGRQLDDLSVQYSLRCNMEGA